MVSEESTFSRRKPTLKEKRIKQSQQDTYEGYLKGYLEGQKVILDKIKKLMDDCLISKTAVEKLKQGVKKC